MSVDLPPLDYRPDEPHERNLSTWSTGWDACMAWLWPMYIQATADADRFWSAAYAPTPKPKFGPSYADRRRVTSELQEQRAAEMRGAA